MILRVVSFRRARSTVIEVFEALNFVFGKLLASILKIQKCFAPKSIADASVSDARRVSSAQRLQSGVTSQPLHEELPSVLQDIALHIKWAMLCGKGLDVPYLPSPA